MYGIFIDETEKVKLYILNSMGQYVGTLLNEEVGPGIHQFDFTTQNINRVEIYLNTQRGYII